MRTLALLALPALLSAQTIVRPALPRAFVDTTAYPTTGRTIRVAAGDNAALQAALDTALGGDAIVLPDGSTFAGAFQLKPHSGSSITLRSATMPSAGRVDSGATFATLVAPTGQPALATTDGAAGWRIVGVRFVITPASIDNYGIVVIGSGSETTVAAQPSQIVLDRVVIDGGDAQTSRCVALNGSALAVINSRLLNCHGVGRDAQAIAGWSGAGPMLISNNYLEASGEVVIFGGSDSRIANQTPSDITIRGNVMTRPLAWAGRWLVKNLFELKHAERVEFAENTLSNNWANGQIGHAILFQTVNQDGGNPWAHISDVTIRDNVIRTSTHGVTLLSRFNGDPRLTPMKRILLERNRFEGIGPDPISGTTGARFFQLLGDLQDVSILNNTFRGDGAAQAIGFDGAPMSRLVVIGNVFDVTAYGIFGGGVGVGLPAIAQYAPDAVITGNTFAGQIERLYPAGNLFPATLPDSLPPAPPVVTPPVTAPRTCDGAPVGYAATATSGGVTDARTEVVTVKRGADCLGVTVLASATRYAAHARTANGWRLIGSAYTSRKSARDAVVTAAGR